MSMRGLSGTQGAVAGQGRIALREDGAQHRLMEHVDVSREPVIALILGSETRGVRIGIEGSRSTDQKRMKI